MCIISTEVSSESIVGNISLLVAPVINGIKFPTNMTFLYPDDILLLEKNDGTVKRIVNGSMLDEPLLDVNMAKSRKNGISITKQSIRMLQNTIYGASESAKMDVVYFFCFNVMDRRSRRRGKLVVKILDCRCYGHYLTIKMIIYKM